MNKFLHFKHRLLLALLAAFIAVPQAWTDDNPISIGTSTYATLDDAIAAANDGDEIDINKAGTYQWNGIGKNITNTLSFVAKVDSVIIEHRKYGDTDNDRSMGVFKNATFKNVTFDLGTTSVTYHGFYTGSSITMEKCQINGLLFSYGDMTFTNCTFNQTAENYNMWVYGDGTVTYDSCTFNTAKGALNIYCEPENKAVNSIKVKNCTFNATKETTKTPLNIKTAGCSHTIKIYGANKVNDNFKGTDGNAAVTSSDRLWMSDAISPGSNSVAYVDENGKENLVYGNVAQVLDADGNTVGTYASLAEAVSGATDAQTVQLIADITGQNTTLTINKSLTLDLNGHTLSGEGGGGNTTRRMFLLQLDKSKTVTITDSGNGNGISMTLPEATFGGDNFCIDQHQGTLKLTNVKVAFNTANATLGGNPYAVYANYGANLNIENSTITATDKLRPMPVGTGNSVMNNVKTSVNIESSTLNANATPAESSTSTWAVGLWHSGAEATINNTVINATSNGKGAYCVRNYGGLVTVKGSNSQFKTSAPAWAICMTTESDSSKLDIQDGTFIATVPDDATNLGSSQMLFINNDATETVCTISGGKFLVKGKETSLFNGGIRHIQLTGGYYSVQPNSVCLASGYGLYDLTGVEGYSCEVAPVVAQIGTTVYKSLQEAFDAATEGQTITLANDASGNGVILYASQKKNLTLDLNGHTYTVSGKAVGSKNTENQAFHFEKGNTVTIKNGKLTSTSSEVIMFIQNYSNLTLDSVTVDATNIRGTYAVSNNCGSLTTSGATTITAPAGGVAFDVYYWYPYYREGVSVTINEGTKINGKIEYDAPSSSPDNWEEKTNLKINGGTFSNFSIELYNTTTPYKAGITISGGTFDAAVNEDYCAADFVPAGTTDSQGNVTYGVTAATDDNAISYKESEAGETKFMTGSHITIDDTGSNFYSFNVPSDMTGKTITYTRKFSNTNYKAWFVPFEVSAENDYVTFYEFKNINYTTDENNVATGGWSVVLSPVTSGTIEANIPYVIKPKNTGTITFNVSDATVKALTDNVGKKSQENMDNSALTIQGIYKKKTVTKNDWGWYTFTGTTFSQQTDVSAGKNYVAPFRFYLVLTDKNGNVNQDYYNSQSKGLKLIIDDDDDPTGINGVETNVEPQNEVIYDLQGRRITNPSKGIYIINGKKVIIK